LDVVAEINSDPDLVLSCDGIHKAVTAYLDIYADRYVDYASFDELVNSKTSATEMVLAGWKRKCSPQATGSTQAAK